MLPSFNTKSLNRSTGFQYDLGGSTRLASDISGSLSPRINSNIINEMIDINRHNNDADYYADIMLKHIRDYGDSDILWKDVANLTEDMKELVVTKVVLMLGVRGDPLKAIIPLRFLTSEEKKAKHLRQLVEVFKFLGRTDLVTHIHEKYKH